MNLSSQSKPTCPNCGEKLPGAGDAFCVYCHEPLDEDDVEAEFIHVGESEVPSICANCKAELKPSDFQTKLAPWTETLGIAFFNVVAALLLFFVFGALLKIIGFFLAAAVYLKFILPTLYRRKQIFIQCSQCNWTAKYATTSKKLASTTRETRGPEET